MNIKYTEIDIVRGKCLNDFSFYVRYMFKKLNNKKFTVNTHHNKLFDFANRVYTGEITKGIINIAPRYSKTEVIVKMYISWCLAKNPASRFIHLSYSDSLALDNSAEIRDIINSYYYQELFPYVQIKKDSKAKEKWYTTEGGGILARSAAGQVTGFGAGQTNFEDDELQEFGGAIIIDDPIKPDDANSEILRERVNTKFNTTVRNRVNSEETPIIIIMQRLHPEDLCGMLIEKEPEDWYVLSMPVINDDGTALWDAKHNIYQLNKMKDNLGTIFETQYMQNPEPTEGYLIPRKKIRLLPNNYESDIIRRIVIIDPAEKNGDMMSSIFCELSTIDNRFNCHIYDVVYSNKGFEYVSEVVHEKSINDNVSEIIFEKNGVGLATGVSLKNKNENKDYKLTPYHETQNKDAKILNNYEFVLRHFSFDSEYESKPEFVKFIKHLTQYSSEKHQPHSRDAIDNCCSASKILKVMYKKMI